MTIIATLRDGRIIAKGSLTSFTASGPGPVYTSATLSELRKVEEVLQVNMTTNVQVTPQTPTPAGNVVGLSVYVGTSTGTAITGDVLAIGY